MSHLTKIQILDFTDVPTGRVFRLEVFSDRSCVLAERGLMRDHEGQPVEGVFHYWSLADGVYEDGGLCDLPTLEHAEAQDGSWDPTGQRVYTAFEKQLADLLDVADPFEDEEEDHHDHAPNGTCSDECRGCEEDGKR